jgi:hypothetical protein
MSQQHLQGINSSQVPAVATDLEQGAALLITDVESQLQEPPSTGTPAGLVGDAVAELPWFRDHVNNFMKRLEEELLHSPVDAAAEEREAVIGKFVEDVEHGDGQV